MTETTRATRVDRTTGETTVSVAVDLDGTGTANISTGVGFLDHMLTLLAHHSLIDLTIEAQGDTQVDDHHTVEDVGITLGQALAQALGERRGIQRYGHALTPMDEALALVAIDISGRGLLAFDVHFTAPKLGTFDTELVREFWHGVAMNARMTLHIRNLTSRDLTGFQNLSGLSVNNHHLAEAVFKGVAHALREAVAPDPRRVGVPSTKGTL